MNLRKIILKLGLGILVLMVVAGLAKTSFGSSYPNLPLGTIDMESPIVIVGTPDSSYIYVATYGGDKVSVIRTSDDTVVEEIPNIIYPYVMTISHDGTKVYVGSTTEGVYEIDTNTNTVTAQFNPGPAISGVALTPDENRLYSVHNPYGQPKYVTVTDTVSYDTVATIDFPYTTQVFGIAIAPDGETAYVGNRDSGLVYVIDMATDPNTITDMILTPSAVSPIITSDGKTLYVCNHYASTVSLIDLETKSVTVIPVQSGPNFCSLTPDEKYLFVANTMSNTVSVIDTNTNTVIETITGFNRPHGIGITPDGKKAYVANLHGDSVSVLVRPIITVAIDIKPGSCPNPFNVKSQGVLPVAILGTEDFDVTDIDLSSIRLAGVAPIRSSIEDVSTPLLEKQDECDCISESGDGIDDLTLKFDTQEIISALGEIADGDELVLSLTGALSDGTPIEGEDCIIILSKGKGKEK